MKFIIIIFIISHVFSNPKENNDLHWTQKIFIKENNLSNNEVNVKSDLVKKNNNIEELPSTINDKKNEISKPKTE